MSCSANCQRRGVDQLSKAGKVGDIGEKRRNFTALAGEASVIAAIRQTLGEIWRKIARQRRVCPFGLHCRRRASRTVSTCRMVLL